MWNIVFLIVFGLGGGYVAEYADCYWWSGVLAGLVLYVILRWSPQILNNIGDVID